jgi:hypothetical protein
MYQIDPNLKNSLAEAMALGETTQTITASAAIGLGDALSLTSNIKIHRGPRPYGYLEIDGCPVIVGETCAIKAHAEDGRTYIYDEAKWIQAVNTYNGIKPIIYASSPVSREVAASAEAFTRADMISAFNET